MEGSFIFNENENLTYDDLYVESSNSMQEYEFGMQIDDFEKESNKIQYSKEQIENILKEYIENMVIEIEGVINEKFNHCNFVATYNRYVNNWNEILCSIKINENLVEVKLTNDYICDDTTNISSVYITLFSGGKGIFTECIERINQEYEFIDSTYAYEPVNENELCFKKLDKDKFIECIVSEINKIK